ncbi:Outer membrane protein assembly factor BamB precursor [Novipirellula aureliae]|uniref:Outer membrane protein assembly factor BamB n=2 Tax=Novipirellula aureliae TaxID=2527966 RepID=A0A5C6E9C4_9BACT|nr:Outer membrane protein assembly factor BamB precursor [Novipirellula aureliae]
MADRNSHFSLNATAKGSFGGPRLRTHGGRDCRVEKVPLGSRKLAIDWVPGQARRATGISIPDRFALETAQRSPMFLTLVGVVFLSMWLISTHAAAENEIVRSVPENLSVQWEFQADEAIEAAPVVAEKLIFVADVMGKLYAVDRSNGKLVWNHDFDTGFIAAPAVQENRLVIGDVEGNVYAIEADSGTIVWQKQTDGEINGSAAFYKSTVLVTSQDGSLYSFESDDGTLKWTYQTDDQIRCSPTIAGTRTFLGGCDGRLHVVDLETGKGIGEPMPLGGPTGSTVAVAGNLAVLPIMDGAVLSFDWKTAKQIWRYVDEERSQEYRSSAAIQANTVVVSSQKKQVDALSLKTGERLWRYSLQRRADASPVIAGDDVWIAATDGRLIRLSLQEGKEIWKFEIRGSFVAAPVIEKTPSGSVQLYVADDNGILRCFE